MTSRLIRPSLALYFLIVAAACGSGNDVTSPSGNTAYTGTYNLRTVSFNTLPALVGEQPGYRLEVVDGDWKIKADFTQNLRIKFKLIKNGTTTFPEWNSAGTYSVRNFGNEAVLDISIPEDKFASLTNDVSKGTISGAMFVPASVVTDANGQHQLLSVEFGK